MDGATLSAHVLVPYFVSAISMPRTIPGTAAERHPSRLSRVGVPLVRVGPAAIARRTGQPVGQVELILALRRQMAANSGSRS